MNAITPTGGEEGAVEKCPLCAWGSTYHGGREGVIVCPNCGWDSDPDDLAAALAELERTNPEVAAASRKVDEAFWASLIASSTLEEADRG